MLSSVNILHWTQPSRLYNHTFSLWQQACEVARQPYWVAKLVSGSTVYCRKLDFAVRKREQAEMANKKYSKCFAGLEKNVHVVLAATVRHSQAVTGAPLKAWLIAEKCGAIICNLIVSCWGTHQEYEEYIMYFCTLPVASTCCCLQMSLMLQFPIQIFVCRLLSGECLERVTPHRRQS